VKNSDILVIDVASGHVKFLTRGGSATLTRGLSDYVDLHDFGRLRSFWWSPDSRSIAYAETDSSSVIQSGQKDNFYPGLSQTGVSCPIAGGINPLVRLGVVPASGGKTVWCGYSSKTFPYLIRVDWQQHAPLSAVILSRDQKVEELLSVTPISGAVHVLLKETDPAWVSTATDNRHENSMCTPYWLSDGSGFLWLTEGRGDWQIEIRDWAGSVIRQITPPGLHVRGIDDLNEAQGILTFEASPDARECQLYRTNFRGGVCSPISHSIGEHSAVFSADHKTYSDSFSINDGEQGADIYSAVTGFRLARLPSLAEMPPALPNIRYFKVGSQQGFDAVVILPTVFKKNAHYPVLLVINPVLGENAVTAALRTYCDLSWYADQGYIVVSVDTAGTPDRGRNNEDAVKGDLIDLPLEEQAAALSDLSKKVPEMDMTRVGVLGDGVGGSVAIAAAIRHPSLFACSIAISPLVDWNTVEVGLAERYLDMPKNDSAGYNSSSVIRYAGAAQRPLLLLQDASAGPLEFESSLRLATEIYRSGDPVDFVPIGLGSKKLDKANGVIALHTAILRFVSEELK
jgi:dipeptidyl-peptidase-4